MKTRNSHIKEPQSGETMFYIDHLQSCESTRYHVGWVPNNYNQENNSCCFGSGVQQHAVAAAAAREGGKHETARRGKRVHINMNISSSITLSRVFLEIGSISPVAYEF